MGLTPGACPLVDARIDPDEEAAASPSTPGSVSDYWRKRWSVSDASWHQAGVHPMLERFHDQLLGDCYGCSVLVPLCGCADDMGALALRGHEVVGCEGEDIVIDQLFASFGDELDTWSSARRITLETADVPRHAVRAARSSLDSNATMRVVQGDFTALDASTLGSLGLRPFDAAFDRAAIVAVEPDVRPRYAAVLSELLAAGGRVLLVVVEHTGAMNGSGSPNPGPPFSIGEPEVRDLFEGAFDVSLLERDDKSEQYRELGWLVEGGFYHEVAYLLTRRGGPVACKRG